MGPHSGGMITRRRFLRAAAAPAAASTVAASAGCARATRRAGTPDKTRVAILRASGYRADLVDRLARGAELCGLNAPGKRVLLKPNLVEYDRTSVIHTQAEVLAAAVELFERLGASEVIIGEGPGHRRDAWFLAEEAGYRATIPRFDSRFVDLNRDEVARVAPFAGGSG